MYLIVVDVQNGFINNHTKHVVSKIQKLITSHSFPRVLFTQFINSRESPYTKILGWHRMYDGKETEIVSELQPYVTKKNLFKKDGLGCEGLKLVPYLRKNKISHVTLVGLETDACVLKTSLDLLEQNCKVTVISDLCASTKGRAAHSTALRVLQRNLGKENIVRLSAFYDSL